MTDNVVFTHAGATLPFPPLTKSHILNCSYHSWHPRYRTITPKARLIPLPQPCIDYLRADGIVLPPDDDEPQHAWSDSDSGVFSSADNVSEADDEDDDPSAEWRETHESIKSTIIELGGKVIPKLNWSAPKDATWIAATNSMECCNPNDIYLLLKSSDFVTHDLEHAFDECVGDESLALASIPYHLILRKHFQLNPSLEFRCFVRNRKLIALCQRDLNHFDFLFNLQDYLGTQIQLFFDLRLRDTFPDENFVFDVYVPPPHNKVWLVDINPWARRTDPLLFSWMELLSTPEPRDLPAKKQVETPKAAHAPVAFQSNNLAQEQNSALRLQLRRSPLSQSMSASDFEEREEEGENSEDDVEDIFIPEFRLVRRDDPEAYGFTTPQYSAHKLPRDVVDASRGGESGMREFAEQWKELVHKMEHQADLREGDDSEEE